MSAYDGLGRALSGLIVWAIVGMLLALVATGFALYFGISWLIHHVRFV